MTQEPEADAAGRRLDHATPVLWAAAGLVVASLIALFVGVALRPALWVLLALVLVNCGFWLLLAVLAVRERRRQHPGEKSRPDRFGQYVLPALFVLAGLAYLVRALLTGGGVGGVLAGAAGVVIGVGLFFGMRAINRR